jgi:predicted SnoaL-like aldol condensation-catalyzing enzyme
MFERTGGAALALAIAAAAAPALAQPAPRPACTLSPAEIEANRQAAMAFFRPGVTAAERIAMVDPGYVQHNPVFRKFGEDNRLGDYEAFKARLAQGFGPPPGAAVPAGPTPPPPDPYALVTADCDLVTILHKNFRQVPGAVPGTWYEAFTFDTFRVRNGKFTEHWDAAVLPPAG